MSPRSPATTSQTWGPTASDTVATLRALGLQCTGAASNITAACAPVIVERAGKRFWRAQLQLRGPRESWATSRKAGCAYVKVLTHYEAGLRRPRRAQRLHLRGPTALEAMQDDITALRAKVDVVLVALPGAWAMCPPRSRCTSAASAARRH